MIGEVLEHEHRIGAPDGAAGDPVEIGEPALDDGAGGASAPQQLCIEITPQNTPTRIANCAHALALTAPEIEVHTLRNRLQQVDE